MPRSTCEYCYEDLAYHHHRNLGCPGGRLTIYKQLAEPVYWNPYNKVVQDHRDGTIYEYATNAARTWLGLPVPWLAEYGEEEVRQPPMELPQFNHSELSCGGKTGELSEWLS